MDILEIFRQVGLFFVRLCNVGFFVGEFYITVGSVFIFVGLVAVVMTFLRGLSD